MNPSSDVLKNGARTRNGSSVDRPSPHQSSPSQTLPGAASSTFKPHLRFKYAPKALPGWNIEVENRQNCHPSIKINQQRLQWPWSIQTTACFHWSGGFKTRITKQHLVFRNLGLYVDLRKSLFDCHRICPAVSCIGLQYKSSSSQVEASILQEKSLALRLVISSNLYNDLAIKYLNVVKLNQHPLYPDFKSSLSVRNKLGSCKRAFSVKNVYSGGRSPKISTGVEFKNETKVQEHLSLIQGVQMDFTVTDKLKLYNQCIINLGLQLRLPDTSCIQARIDSRGRTGILCSTNLRPGVKFCVSSHFNVCQPRSSPKFGISLTF